MSDIMGKVRDAFDRIIVEDSEQRTRQVPVRNERRTRQDDRDHPRGERRPPRR